jgi:hypothetical protein
MLKIQAQITVEKILKTLTVDGKDVRKADWTNKEVNSPYPLSCVTSQLDDEKEHPLDNPALRGGSNAPYSH